MQIEYHLTHDEQRYYFTSLRMAAAGIDEIDMLHLIEYNPNYVGLFMTARYRGEIVTILVSYNLMDTLTISRLRYMIHESLERAHSNVQARRLPRRFRRRGA